MNRAYSVLTIKSQDAEQRIIRGIASTPTMDRAGDIVEPMGAKFKTPMPLLWMHEKDKPVGRVTFAQPTPEGIPFEAHLPEIEEAGTLKDRVDEAWQSVEAGLISAVSIGFLPVPGKSKRLKEGGLRFMEWEWYELSLVSIPANAEATISAIKSFDDQLLAASGNKSSRSATAGVSATSKSAIKTPLEAPMNIAEQIKSFENTRAAKAARMEAMMAKSAEEGRTLDEEESDEYEELEQELAAIDKHLVRLSKVEKSLAAKAKPVDGEKVNSTKGHEFRDNAVIRVERNLPKGTAFTRYAIALARSKGNLMQAAEISKSWHESTPEVETVLKAAVAAGTTTDPAWAAPLVEYQNMASEFIELLRPQTIIGKFGTEGLPALRRVPFNIRMPGQTGGSSVGWVGEGKAKPVSALSFETNTLRFSKAAGIVVMTDELVRFSNPSAEAIVQADLTASIAQFLDEQFINPAVAEVPEVNPASITNGATSVPASGVDAEAFRTDLRALRAVLTGANLSTTGTVLVMSEIQADALADLTNPLGQSEFPDISSTGGRIRGLPVITSQSVPAGMIILVKASEILLADDGGVALDVSREASLEMDSAPGGEDATLISLWQQNMVGLRAERFINWKRRRPQAVAYITGANYGGEEVTP